MATSRRLSDGWTLTDGVFKPFLLSRQMDVASALREQGLIPRNPCGKEFLQEEWIYLHTFSYALSFALPEDDDEIAALYFSGLCGAGTVLINGEAVWAFRDESAHIPIPCRHLKAGDNLLEVRFAPQNGRAPFGITGDVFLRTTNYLMLVSSRFSGTGHSILCSTELETFTAGKYVFKYTLSLDDQAVQNFEFIERLKAISRAKIAHELPIPSPVHWDAASPDETCYTVRLSIERMGIGCELVRGDVALLKDGYAPQRIVKLPQGGATDRTLRLIKELGAEAVAVDTQTHADHDAPLFYPNFLRYGLLTVDAQAYQPLPCQRAVVPLELLREKAGDMDDWPSDAPFWKLLGAAPLDVALYERRFGVNATGDARRCIEYSRTLQAEQLERDLTAQMSTAAPVMIEPLIDPAFVPISSALIDPNFEKRPAFEALKAAWNKVSSF